MRRTLDERWQTATLRRQPTREPALLLLCWLHPSMRQWTATGLPVAEVGFELADDKGQMRPKAELA